ncbi:hypothetical protein D3C71_1327150 [compost metagenome]
MQNVRARQVLEHRTRQVLRRAHATGAIVQFAGFGAGGRHQVRDRLEPRLLGHFQDVRDFGHEGDRREVLRRVEAQPRIQVRVGGIGGTGGHQQRIAVGLFAHEGGRADVAARAGLVVHDHGLAQAFGQALREQPPQRVRCATGRPGHDQLDGALGIGLRVDGGGDARGKRGQDERAAGAPQEGEGHGVSRSAGPCVRVAWGAAAGRVDVQARRKAAFLMRMTLRNLTAPLKG